MQITSPQLREKLQDLFAVISDISQTLVTFAAATITGVLTVGGRADLNGGLDINSSSNTFADTTTWVLSATEEATVVILAEGTTGGATDIEATPTDGRAYYVKNSTGSNITFKANGQTGITIADGTNELVIGNGTDFV